MNSLFAALDADDKVKLAQLISFYKDSNLNVSGAAGNSLMFKALEVQSYDLVELLLDNGIDPNLTKLSGAKLLHLLVKEAPVPVIAKVIEKGADTNATEQCDFTPLHLAARANRSDVVELLISKGANVNAQNDHGWTPLHSAVHLGNIAAIKALLKNGARTTMPDKKGWTPLHVAVSKNYKSTLEVLGTSEIDSEQLEALQNAKMISPLHLAAKLGNIEAISILLLVLPVDIIDKNGWTPLMLAILSEKQAAVENLLRAGADPNKANSVGVAPIHLAVKAKNTHLMRILLDARADVNKPDKNGYTALHVACMSDLVELVKMLLGDGARTAAVTESKLTPLHIAVHLKTESGKQIAQLLINNSTSETIQLAYKGDWTPLRIAMQEDNVQMLILLAESGCSVDFHYGKNGTTPLCWAAKSENITDVQGLIEVAKASPNLAQKSNGWTPLHFAASKGNAEICRYLMAHSADPNTIDRFFRTPLDVAYVSKTQNDVESVFLEFGAKPHVKNSEKGTYESIHEAIARRDFEAVEEILKEDSSKIHARDPWGNTPLHTAIQAKRPKMFEVLLQYEPDVNAKGENERTPLHFACIYQTTSSSFVTSLFKKGNPNPNAEDTDGKTPLHYATHEKTKTILIDHGADTSVVGKEKEKEKKEDEETGRGKRGGRRGRGGRGGRGGREGRGGRGGRERGRREERGSREEERRPFSRRDREARRSKEEEEKSRVTWGASESEVTGMVTTGWEATESEATAWETTGMEKTESEATAWETTGWETTESEATWDTSTDTTSWDH